MVIDAEKMGVWVNELKEKYASELRIKGLFMSMDWTTKGKTECQI